MVDIITKLLLLLSPIVYGVNINLDKFDVRFFEIGVIILFIASLFDEPKRKFNFSLPIILLLGLVIINSFWHRFQPQDIHAIQLLFYGILAFYIITRYLKDIRGCYKYIFWALGINLAVLLFQKIGYSPILSFSHPGLYMGCEGGMLGNNAKFGIYLALILPYLPLIVAISLAFIFGLLLPYAQLSMLIPLGLIMFFRTKNRFYRFLTIATGVVIILIFHSKVWTSILLRWRIWEPVIEMVFERPLLGWGFGTYHLWTATESFNSYLPFIYGVGLIGGIAWLGYIFRDFFRKFSANKESLAVLSLVVICLIEYPLEIPRLWFTIIAVLSFYAIKQMEVKIEGKIYWPQ